jgi:hypothetical protein
MARRCADTIRPMPHPRGRRQGEVTVLLRQRREGDQGALERLSELIHGELRRMARGYLAGEWLYRQPRSAW